MQENNPIAKVLLGAGNAIFNPKNNPEVSNSIGRVLLGAGADGVASAPSAPQQPQSAPVGSRQSDFPLNGVFGSQNESGNSQPRRGTAPTQQPMATPNRNDRYDTRVAAKMLKMYTDAGYSREFAAGMVANGMVESGGNTTAFNQNEGAYGMFQHRADRLENLRAFAANSGVGVDDLGAQVSFSIREMQTFERAAYDRIMSGNPQTAAEYARLVDKHWERSDGSARDRRASLASDIFGDFYGPEAEFNDTTRPPLTFPESHDPNGIQDTDPRNIPHTDEELSRDGFGGMRGAPIEITQPEITPLNNGNRAQPSQNPASYPTAPTNGTSTQSSQVGSAGADELDDDGKPLGKVRAYLKNLVSPDGLSDDERRIRRRSMAEAFTVGLGYLTSGQADLSGVFSRRDESYANLDAKEQATIQRQEAIQTSARRSEGLAKMAQGMGLGQLSGLAYLGDDQQKVLTGAMVKSMSSNVAGAYNMDPESRATLANSVAGQSPALARIISNPNSTGKVLEDAVTRAMDASVKGDTASGSYNMDEASRTALAGRVGGQNSALAEILMNPSVTGKALEDAAQAAYKVPTGGESPEGFGEAYATELEQRGGVDPQIISMARNATNAAEVDLVRDLVGDSDETTDLKNFKRVDPENYSKMLEGDPEAGRAFEKYMLGQKKAASGTPEGGTFQQGRREVNIEKEDEGLRKLTANDPQLTATMGTIKEQLLNPKYESGMVQSAVILPLQNFLDSAGIDFKLVDNNPLRLVDALQKQNIGIFRVEGSGATSDFEANAFLKSGVTISDTRMQGLLLSQYHLKTAQFRQDELRLREEYFEHNKNDNEKYYDANGLKDYIADNSKNNKVYHQVKFGDDPRTVLKGLYDSKQLAKGDIYISHNEDGSYNYNVFGYDMKALNGSK